MNPDTKLLLDEAVNSKIITSTQAKQIINLVDAMKFEQNLVNDMPEITSRRRVKMSNSNKTKKKSSVLPLAIFTFVVVIIVCIWRWDVIAPLVGLG